MFNIPNRRRERRFYLKRPHRVVLVDPRTRKPVEGLLVNVSRSGMCVALDQRLPDDVEPSLAIAGKRVGLRPIWDLAGLHGDELYRYGFQCRDRNVDLLVVFRQAGLDPGLLQEKAQTDEEVFAAQLDPVQAVLPSMSVQRGLC
ncbi:MAG: hypothetical protein KDK91_08430 [Gammaproteobacteria bacterium]|nr:hypothetical protein [Gammaproteobacteria bacterium]